MTPRQREKWLLGLIGALASVLFSILVYHAKNIVDSQERVNVNLLRIEGRFILLDGRITDYQNANIREQDQILRRLEILENKGR